MTNKDEQQKMLYEEGLNELGIQTEENDNPDYENVVNDFIHYRGYTQAQSERAAKNVLLYEHLN